MGKKTPLWKQCRRGTMWLPTQFPVRHCGDVKVAADHTISSLDREHWISIWSQAQLKSSTVRAWTPPLSMLLPTLRAGSSYSYSTILIKTRTHSHSHGPTWSTQPLTDTLLHGDPKIQPWQDFRNLQSDPAPVAYCSLANNLVHFMAITIISNNGCFISAEIPQP